MISCNNNSDRVGLGGTGTAIVCNSLDLRNVPFPFDIFRNVCNFSCYMERLSCFISGLSSNIKCCSVIVTIVTVG